MTAAEHESDLKLTADTPYLALTGELWGVCYEDIGESYRVITAPHCNILVPFHPFKSLQLIIPVDEIYSYPIFIRVAVTSLNEWVSVL